MVSLLLVGVAGSPSLGRAEVGRWKDVSIGQFTLFHTPPMRGWERITDLYWGREVRRGVFPASALSPELISYQMFPLNFLKPLL